VGGVGVIKGAKGDNDDGDAFGNSGQQVSEVRMRNLARMYAWWIAKDGVSLMVLKVRSSRPSLEYPFVDLLRV